MLLYVDIYIIFEVAIGLNTIYMFDTRGVITMNLITRPGAKLKNNAISSLQK